MVRGREPAGVGTVEGQRGAFGHEGRPHLTRRAVDHVALRRPPVVQLTTKRRRGYREDVIAFASVAILVAFANA